MNLTGWLRATPQPSTVIADGKPLAVGHGGGKWSRLVRTIEALKATKLECHDSQGHIIRAIELDDPAAENGLEVTKAEHQPPAQCCPQCGVSLNMIATLISDAYDRGNNSQAKAYGASFDAHTKLVEMLVTRLSSAESARERALALQLKLHSESTELRAALESALAQAQAGGGDSDSLLAAFLGAMQTGQLTAQAGKNGKGPSP